MQIKVNTSDFQKAIHTVEGVISAREIKSLLSNIKIEVIGNQIFLSATDLEISIKTSLSAEVIKEGKASIPAKQLGNIVKTINFQNLMLETQDQDGSPVTTLTDADGKYDFTTHINGIDADEIKTIEQVDTSQLTEIPCSLLNDMFKKTSYAMATDDARFIFNGLFLVQSETKAIVVGTDGRRLSKIERQLPSPLHFEQGIVIPVKAVREIQRMLTMGESVKVGLIDGQIYASVGSTELLCKLIEGTFPNYEQVIPKNPAKEVKLPKESFVVHLRQALSVAEEPTKQVRITLAENKMSLFAQTMGSQNLAVSIPVEYDSDSITIAFKGEYLNDINRAIDDEEIIMQFTDSSAPVLFRDPSDSEFVSVIMPMKI